MPKFDPRYNFYLYGISCITTALIIIIHPVFSDGGSSTDITTHVLPFSSYAITHSCGPNSHVCCQFDFYQKKCFQGKKKIPIQDVNDGNIKERYVVTSPITRVS